MLDKLNYFIDTKLPWFSMPQQIGISNIIEIIILAIIIYHVTSWIQNKKIYTLLKGIVIVFVFYIISYMFNFYVFLWFFDNCFQLIIISIAVIFQPELRKALESIGQKKISLFRILNFDKSLEIEKFTDKSLEEIIKATKVMSQDKTGALILIEQENSLIEYEQTGITINADISNQLLINIFEHNTPLHDGALIIKNNQISAATCYLPLSENQDVSKALGTRHRAAIGASEATDATIIIVSEETGKISVAKKGNLEHGITEERLREILKQSQQKEIIEDKYREKIRKKIEGVKEYAKGTKNK